jgi:hypothetical protein
MWLNMPHCGEYYPKKISASLFVVSKGMDAPRSELSIGDGTPISLCRARRRSIERWAAPSGMRLGQNHHILLKLGSMLPPCEYCNKPKNIAQSHGNFRFRLLLLHWVGVSSIHTKQRRG